jgi:regulator of RNase E activity RraA
MVGFAKTAMIRARDPVSELGYMQKRMDYLDYVAAAPRPSVVVIEDKDEPAGYGAFWGEVQTNVHKALGCLGTVTNGSIRDIASIAEGFQMLAGSIAPSHAYVHIVEFGLSVNVHGMEVQSGALIHADRHGAVVVPVENIDAMAAALDGLMKREASIIAARPRAGRYCRDHQSRDEALIFDAGDSRYHLSMAPVFWSACKQFPSMGCIKAAWRRFGRRSSLASEALSS